MKRCFRFGIKRAGRGWKLMNDCTGTKKLMRTRMKELLLTLALAAMAILLVGGVDLVFSMLRFPNVGFGQENMEITGCGRMDGVIRFKYFYWFCLWFGLLSPLLICPAVILLQKQKAWMIALLCMLPLFSYFEVNAGVQAGFHYRGQLLERFGKQTDGYMAVDRLMPSDVRKEYDWGPRSKKCVVAGLLGWAYWPLWNLLWVPLLLYPESRIMRARYAKNSLKGTFFTKIVLAFSIFYMRVC